MSSCKKELICIVPYRVNKGKYKLTFADFKSVRGNDIVLCKRHFSKKTSFTKNTFLTKTYSLKNISYLCS